MKTALFIFTVDWKVGMLPTLLGFGGEEMREAGSLGGRGNTKSDCTIGYYAKDYKA
jgi:hypothetical protein